jgi:predicted transcriptional regulator
MTSCTRCNVKKKIELGIKAADEGRVVPHEEVKRMFSVE